MTQPASSSRVDDRGHVQDSRSTRDGSTVSAPSQGSIGPTPVLLEAVNSCQTDLTGMLMPMPHPGRVRGYGDFAAETAASWKA